MSQQYVRFSNGNLTSGESLWKIRDEHIAAIQPDNEGEIHSDVTGCVLARFTESEKALYAS